MTRKPRNNTLQNRPKKQSHLKTTDRLLLLIFKVPLDLDRLLAFFFLGAPVGLGGPSLLGAGRGSPTTH
jgi:hypothetical protein